MCGSPDRTSGLFKPGAGSGFIGKQFGVFCDADHGEDFLEVWRQAKSLDGLAFLARGVEKLDDECDAAGVEILDFGEIEQDAF